MSQLNRRGACLQLARLHDAARHLTPGDLHDHRGSAAAGPIDGRRIGHPLESIRRPARQHEPPRGGPHRERRKLRRFEQDIGGVGGDLGAGVSHHPGQGHGPLRVGNHAHEVGEGVGLVVDGRERLAGKSPPHGDPAAPDSGKIEGVQRLSAFKHHVVGDVDDIVDAGHSHSGQPVNEPLRTRPHPHTLDHPSRVVGTELWLEDLHRDAGCGRGSGLLRAGIGNVERSFKQNGGLASHADVSEAVGAVACHLDLDRRVGAHRPRGLVVETREQQPLDKRLGGRGQAHVVGEPVRGDDHGLGLRSGERGRRTVA